MNNKFNKFTAISILLIILAFALIFFLLPKREFSENENRYLKESPKLSFDSITSGIFMEDIEDYLSDHFPLRNFFISAKTSVEELTGKRKINGVYIAKDNYLIGEYESPQNTERIIDSFNEFASSLGKANSNVSINIMLIPTAVTILDDKLPAFASSNGQEDIRAYIINNVDINSVDVSEYLSKGQTENEMFYRTDHHWTSLGAYEGYKAYCNAVDITPEFLDSFEKETVTNDFHGTLSAKVNRFNEPGDEITVFYDTDAKLLVNYSDTDTASDSLFNFEYLDKRDKYSLFLDNQHPVVTINNENASSDRVLMLVKDSYANSMVQFLVHDFKTIYVLDCRYYKDGPSNFYKEHKDITDALILYNMNTLDGDTGIRSIY